MERSLIKTEIAAAKALAAKLGLRPVSPEIIKLAKHTTLKLSPHPIVARSQTAASPHLSHGRPEIELMIAAHLTSKGAPSVRPTSQVSPGPHHQDGCAITLWEFVEGCPVRDATEARAAVTALATIHRALDDTQVKLPPFTATIDSCEPILSNRSATPRLNESDRLFLQRVYATLRDELECRTLISRPVHGDAHFGNVLMTNQGAVWLDLEAVCAGPIEWDVVTLPPTYWCEFDGTDPELITLLRDLRSVCVSVWCWAAFARSGEVAEAAVHHLGRLKGRFS